MSNVSKENSQFIGAGLVQLGPGHDSIWRMATLIKEIIEPGKTEIRDEPPVIIQTHTDGTPFSFEEMRAESFNEGKLDGMRQAEEQFGDVIQSLAAALEDINQLRESILGRNTADMVKLIMAIAEQIIHTEIASREDIILTTLTEALQAAIRSDEFHIKIHPDDFAVASENKPQIMATISGLKNIHFEADPKITRGGCLVESNLGEVDATIESQLQEIRRHLLDSLDKG